MQDKKTKPTLEYKIKDAISYCGKNPKMSGGWKDEIIDPIAKRILDAVEVHTEERARQASSDRQKEIYKRLVELADKTCGVVNMTDVFALFVEIRKEKGDEL